MNKDTQSWSNSNLTEMEELLQKVQQLETENADISHAYGVTRDVVKGLCEELANLKAENAALRNELASLKHQTQWECSCGGTDCEGQKENAALRSLLREAIREHVDPYDLPEGDAYIARVEAALGEAKPCQCTNGVIRSMGRDNDEVIEDCPDCSDSREAKP